MRSGLGVCIGVGVGASASGAGSCFEVVLHAESSNTNVMAPRRALAEILFIVITRIERFLTLKTNENAVVVAMLDRPASPTWIHLPVQTTDPRSNLDI